jgi:hypothetical protein
MRKLITTIATAGLFSLATFTGAYAALADHAEQRAAVLAACSLTSTPAACAEAKAAYQAVLAADPDISEAELAAELGSVTEEVLEIAVAAVEAACGTAGNATACRTLSAALTPISVAAGVEQEDLAAAFEQIVAVADPTLVAIINEYNPNPASITPVPSPTLPAQG